MPTTVFFASNRILTGDPAIVTSYGPNIQPPSVSTDTMYGTAFVDGVDYGQPAGGDHRHSGHEQGRIRRECGERPVQCGP